MPKKIANVSEYSKTTRRARFYKLVKLGKPIPDDMNQELAKDWPTYDPVKRRFTYARNKNKCDRDEFTHDDMDAQFEKYFNAKNCAKKSSATPQIKPTDGLFVVTTDGSKYKNVYINDTKIIGNIKNVKLVTFMDDAVLGIHYTDEKNITQWRLWGINSQPILFDPTSRWVIQSVNCAGNTLYARTDFHALISVSKKNIMHNVINPGRFKIDNVR